MIKQGFYYYLPFITTTLNINVKINENAIAFSVSEKLAPLTPFVEAKPFDKMMFINKTKAQQTEGIKGYTFAKTSNTYLNPENSGEWMETDNGKVWRLGIRSSEAIFYFNYESSSCSNSVTNEGQTLSGGTLIATTENMLYFSLIWLNDIPPASYHAFYAGWIYGLNAAQFTQFAEKFNFTSSIQIPGFVINVAKGFYTQPLSNIVAKVWEGNTLPVTEKYAKVVFIKSLQPNSVNHIGFDSIVKVSGNFFPVYEVNYAAPIDTFAVYHTSNSIQTGVLSMYAYNGARQNISTITSTGISASLGIEIIECYGSAHKTSPNSVNIYSNSCYNNFYIDIPSEITIYNIECFDISGRQVPSVLQFSEEKRL